MKFKALTLLTVLLIIVTACKKNPGTDNNTTCISGNGNADSWTTEDLNTLYTIQCPPWYQGAGYISYKGDYFIKYNRDSVDTTTLNAQYGVYDVNNNVWGTTLINPQATSVDISYGNQNVPLTGKVRLCTGGTTIGYYYYTLNHTDSNTRNKGLGIVYLKENNDFKQSIIINFPETKETEVTDIVSSIKPK